MVGAKGAVLQRIPIQLSPGMQEVRVDLQPAEELTVLLQDSAGDPVEGLVRLDGLSDVPFGFEKLLGSGKPASRHALE